eukprot:TRINITY_DN65939_c0_g1_i1.p1 TRINITY_DN65939_c0_g1~~TRINITY_DN65939_c0_g1_i1.p1  ORF type:complete len:522 (+),score=134.79 TRINITY_DN65939_c0_g1_i1:139-1704(+)
MSSHSSTRLPTASGYRTGPVVSLRGTDFVGTAVAAAVDVEIRATAARIGGAGVLGGNLASYIEPAHSGRWRAPASPNVADVHGPVAAHDSGAAWSGPSPHSHRTHGRKLGAYVEPPTRTRRRPSVPSAADEDLAASAVQSAAAFARRDPPDAGSDLFRLPANWREPWPEQDEVQEAMQQAEAAAEAEADGSIGDGRAAAKAAALEVRTLALCQERACEGFAYGEAQAHVACLEERLEAGLALVASLEANEARMARGEPLPTRSRLAAELEEICVLIQAVELLREQLVPASPGELSGDEVASIFATGGERAVAGAVTSDLEPRLRLAIVRAVGSAAVIRSEPLEASTSSSQSSGSSVASNVASKLVIVMRFRDLPGADVLQRKVLGLGRALGCSFRPVPVDLGEETLRELERNREVLERRVWEASTEDCARLLEAAERRLAEECWAAREEGRVLRERAAHRGRLRSEARDEMAVLGRELQKRRAEVEALDDEARRSADETAALHQQVMLCRAEVDAAEAAAG